jgi:hypothetical protein
MATFSFEEAYGPSTPAAPAPAAKPRPVQPVVMPQPVASAPDPLVAAMQTRQAGLAAAPAVAPMPRQANESPKAFDQRMAKAREDADKAARDAAAPKATADPAAFAAKAQKLRNFEASLQAYKDELAKDLTVFPTEIPLVPSQGMAIPLPVGGDTARIKSKFTTVLMGLKDAYDLGALTGPDMPIILSQLTNPASVSGMLHSKSAFDEQVKVLEDIVKTSKDSLESTYGRKINYDLPGAQPAAAAQRPDPLLLRKK